MGGRPLKIGPWFRAGLGVLLAGVATSAVVMGLWVVARARISAIAGPGPSAAADWLTLALAVLALGLLAWLVTGLVLEALSVVPGAVGALAQTAAARLTPALAARLAVLVLGSAVGTAALPGTAVASDGPAGPRAVATAPDPGFAPSSGAGAAPRAGAGPASRTPTSPAARTDAGQRDRSDAAPEPGFVPGRPGVRPVLTPGVLSASGVARPEGVVVHRGDTLWAIAARDLGPDASDAEVAAHWPRWYAANRHVIGPDPDLLLPGQVLAAPTGATR